MTHKYPRFTIRTAIIYLLLVVSFLSACDDGNKTKKVHIGKTTDSAPYELLIVANKDWLKTSEGCVFMDIINSEIPALPQIETNFKVLTINPTGFTKTFQGFANMIFVEIGSNYPKAEMRIANDVYAHPQLILSIVAPDNKAFVELVETNRQKIVDMFVDAELQREKGYLQKKHSGKVLSQVEKQFGCTLYAPEDINAVKVGKDFMWASSNQADNRLNLCVYSYPYKSEADFSQENFIAKRDSFMKENIQGNKDIQYMTTVKDFVYQKQMLYEGRVIHEFRGLWKMENDMMGGPYVSYSQLDTVNSRVLVAEGFIYAPEKKKRNYIREMEAALRTLKLPVAKISTQTNAK